MDVERLYDARPAMPGRMMTRWGGFLERIEDFDAGFFGISPREAERLDPAQRLVLETAWEGLEDAGVDIARLDGSPTGVFIGQWLSDFEGRLFADPEAVDFQMTTGSGRYCTSGRLSYLLGLHGPSLTVDTACSSSLVAIHLAVRSLRSGESTLALAGGVNIILQPHISIAYSQSRMMAPDGRCKFGDASGDGYVRSEGAGLVVLKPLELARADGDRIYAVIRGSAVNNDGRSSGSMGTPSRVGQEALLRSALQDAGVEPAIVGYVEAHGTGTRAGDPVELAALGAVLGAGRAPARRTLVGSVKTNLGHTEGAAGAAGLIKVALALHHGQIPTSLNCRDLNPAVDWSSAPFAIARQAASWPGAARVGGVSAFGIAGTNAHVVLESAPTALATPSVVSAVPSGRPALLVLSARSPEALRELARRHAGRLAGADRRRLDATCWNAATRRAALECRATFIAHDADAMVERLIAYAAGEAAGTEGTVHAVVRRAPVFIVPGQGGQWIGMARSLMACEPEFRAALEACDAAARPWLDGSLIAQLARDPGQDGFRLDRIEWIQPALVAVAIAYGRWLGSLGIEPSSIVGHSMGEVGAAHLAGALDLDQTMRVICRRSALMGHASGRGAMAMVDLSMADTEKRLAGRERQLAVAVNNSPRSCVVSGDPAALQALLAELEADGVFCRIVKVDVASHSPQMDEPATALTKELGGMLPRNATIPILSTVLARPAEGREFDAAYWGRNLRQPVRFGACIAELVDDGASAFIELGPHPVLVPAIAQTAQSRGVSVLALACGRRDESEVATALTVVASLWCAGHRIDWSRLMNSAVPLDLPSYPWQRERHWVREAAPVDSRRVRGAEVEPIDPAHVDWLHALRWINAVALPQATPVTPQRKVLLVGAMSTDDAICWRRAFAVEQVHLRCCANGADAELALSATEGPPDAIVLLADRVAMQPFDVLNLLRRLAAPEPPGGVGTRLIIATCGAQAVGGHARERVAVDQAALWGLGRVLAEEHPELWGGLVDLDPSADTAVQAAQLAAQVGRGHAESQVAWRDGKRFVLRLQALDLAATATASTGWSTDGAWLITGGLGAVALHLASAMVAQGVRRLVLLGRHPLPPRGEWRVTPAESRDGRRIAAVRALEAAGASVHLLVADVSDAQCLERVLLDYAREAWPPIVGVLHAAGVLETGLATQVDRASFERVFAPKVAGALALDCLLPEVRHFVTISSISATLGIAGMSAYAAANSALDALAHDRRARGRHGLSIQSGAWIDTGMHSGDSAERNLSQLQAMGIQGHRAQDAVALFNALASWPEASVTILPIDWSVFEAAKRGRDLAMFSDRFQIGEQADGAGDGLSERLAATTDATERRRLLEPVVRQAIAQVLKLSPTRVDPRKPLGAMGLNSLMAMELRNRLEGALGRALSATLAWNYPTLESLVAFLCGEPVLRATAPNAQGSTATAPAAAKDAARAIGEVAQLSNEDAARLLRRKR
jgi:acyl transferase domain-containing protein